MSTDLVPTTIPEAMSLAERVAKTEFVPSALRGKPEAVLAAILTGNELGLGPMASLSKIHVIDGRPALAAELMRAVVQSKGHQIWLEESSNTKATVGGMRAGSDKPSYITWTIDDAKRAKLDGKNNWRTYPRAMLVARATGELCRFLFADALAGISYTVEEVEDGFTLEDEETVPSENGMGGRPEGVAGPPRKTSKRKAPAKKADPPTVVDRGIEVEGGVLPPLPGEDGFDAVIDAEIVEGDGESQEETPSSAGAKDGSIPSTDAPSPSALWSKHNPRARAIAADKIPDAKQRDKTWHELIADITDGRTDSSKQLTEDEWQQLFDCLESMPPAELVDGLPQTGEALKQYAADHGKNQTAVLRHANEEHGFTGTLAELIKSGPLEEVVAWLEEA